MGESGGGGPGGGEQTSTGGCCIIRRIWGARRGSPISPRWRRTWRGCILSCCSCIQGGCCRFFLHSSPDCCYGGGSSLSPLSRSHGARSFPEPVRCGPLVVPRLFDTASLLSLSLGAAGSLAHRQLRALLNLGLHTLSQCATYLRAQTYHRDAGTQDSTQSADAQATIAAAECDMHTLRQLSCCCLACPDAWVAAA